MPIKTTRLLLLLTLLVIFGIAEHPVAREAHADAGTSAFPFLKIGVGGRAIGMGGAFTGLADDEASLYYNPAGLASLEGNRYIIGYHNYFDDLQSGFVGIIHAPDLDKSYGLYASYLNLGNFTETDAGGNVLGDFSGGDFLLAGTFALNKSPYLSFGVTAKFIYEKIQNYSSTGLAFDIGAKYTSDRSRYTAGIMVQNLGTQLSQLGEGDSDPLPTTLRVGGGVRPRGLPVTFTSDFILPTDNDFEVAIGAEYNELQPLHLRMGWNSFGSNYRREDGDNGLAGMAFGVGFDYRAMQISYSYTPAADLGESHRITLTGGI